MAVAQSTIAPRAAEKRLQAEIKALANKGVPYFDPDRDIWTFSPPFMDVKKTRFQKFKAALAPVRYLIMAIASVPAGTICLAIIFTVDVYGRVRRWPITKRVKNLDYDGISGRDALYQKFMDCGGSEYDWEMLIES
jgi:hypothetical protein